MRRAGRRPGIAGLALVLSAGLISPTNAAAQAPSADGPVRAGVRLSADTVRVGEPFTVGVVVVGSDSLRFPPLLGVDEGWEQLEVVRVDREPTGEDGASGPDVRPSARAYYRLVAWEAGRPSLPDLTLTVFGAGEAREFRVALPAPAVRSVLPAGAEPGELKLRGPRPPFEDGFPWWRALLLLLLLGGLAAWLWRRLRAEETREAAEPVDVPGPAERAETRLVALRRRVETGELGAAAFYDGLEDILRDYLSDTRQWPSTRPIRAASWLTRHDMRELHRHAVMSRFAGVDTVDARLLEDADVSLRWLRKDAA